ncbi:MAG TPA: hypothetical protein VF519_06970 [Mycobacteriales bacterium]|jgi:hypothetical protein
MRRPLVLAVTAALCLPLTGNAAPPGPLAGAPNLKQVANLSWKGGTDLEITRIKGRRYVVAGAQNNYNKTTSYGLRVVDVENPAKPRVAGFLPCNASQNDVQVKGTLAFLAVDFYHRADGEERRDCWTQARVNPAPGVMVIDISNPARPTAVSFVPVKTGAHNTSVHPTRPLLYVSESESLSTDADNTAMPVHVIDFSKPRAAKVVTTFSMGPGDSAHDITFNAKGTRAYAASGFGGMTVILDTTNPLEPKVVGRVVDPAINFSHQADPTPDGKYLLITDELAGAEGNLYCPGGGIHVWDISNEAVPVKVGAYYIPDTFPSADEGPRPNPVGVGPKIFRCTAHVMRMTPDGKTLVMAWYSQGVQVLDLSGLPGASAGAAGTDAGAGIRRLGNWTADGVDAWSAKMDDRGYIYTGDTGRGMDVVKFDRKAAARTPVDPGVWLDPQQALLRSLQDQAVQTKGRTYFCFERATRLGL